MRITVVGAGYVGLSSAVMLAHVGHEVRLLERDSARARAIERGEDPLGEPHLADALIGGRLKCSTSPAMAYRGAEIVLLAVGTPPAARGGVDMSQLESAVDALEGSLSGGVVLIRSTVPVGTALKLQRGRLRHFRVIANPEFLREGQALEDTLRPERLVAGGDSCDEEFIRGLFKPILDQRFQPLGAIAPRTTPVPFFWMDRTSAELAKYAANAFLATKLSFVNEIANVAGEVGADFRAIARVLGSDPRIGSGFLRPGIGWGGSCFPKDTRALQTMALDHGYDFLLLKAVIEQNNRQLDRFVELLQSRLGGADRRHVVAMMGLTFKAGTSDCRESPAVALAERLLALNWEVRAYDPAVQTPRAGFPEGLQVRSTLADAAANADALIVATEWPEFNDIDFSAMRARMRGDLVFDGRCVIEPARVRAAGLRYVGVCEPSAEQSDPALRTITSRGE